MHDLTDRVDLTEEQALRERFQAEARRDHDGQVATMRKLAAERRRANGARLALYITLGLIAFGGLYYWSFRMLKALIGKH